MTQNFPESDKSWKGHSGKTKSGLGSTKQVLQQELDEALTTPNLKASGKAVYHKVYNLHDDLERKMHTDQMDKF